MRDVQGHKGAVAVAAALLWLAGCGGGAAAGPAPLEVAGTVPAANATGVSIAEDLSVTFKADLDPATVTAGALSVVNGAGATVPGAVSIVGARAVRFRPTAPLAAGSRHTVTLSSGLKALAGGAASGGWSFTTATPPAAPTGLTATLLPTFPNGFIFDVGQVPLELRWQDHAADEAGFAVERNTGGGWTEVTTTLPNVTSYLDPDALICGSYSYRVRALGLAGGDSATTAVATLAAQNTDLSLTVPATTTATSFTIQFQDLDAYFNATPSLYTFEEADDATFANVLRTFTFTYPGVGYQFSTTVTKPAGTVGRFCYRARSDTISCWSAKPACISVNTSDVVAPSVPGGLSATPASGTSVSLGWSPSTDNVGVAAYLVFRDGVQVGRADYALAYQDGGLTAASSHCYRVVAVDLAGNQSAQSAEACLTLPDVTPPSAPTGLQSLYNGITFMWSDLTWVAATDDVGVAEYRIRRCGEVFGPCTDYGYWKSTTATSELNIFEGYLVYCYVVSAVDAAGNESPQSAQACTHAP